MRRILAFFLFIGLGLVAKTSQAEEVFFESYNIQFSQGITVSVTCDLKGFFEENAETLFIVCQKDFGVYAKEVTVVSKLTNGIIFQSVKLRNRFLFFSEEREGVFCLDKFVYRCRFFRDIKDGRINLEWDLKEENFSGKLSLTDLYKSLKKNPQELPSIIQKGILPIFYKTRYDFRLISVAYVDVQNHNPVEEDDFVTLNKPLLEIKFEVLKYTPDGSIHYGDLTFIIDQTQGTITEASFVGAEFSVIITKK